MNHCNCPNCATDNCPEAAPADDGPIVPFHRAKFDDNVERGKLELGLYVELDGDRRVEAWRVAGYDGLYVRIGRPTSDGKTSRLDFGLKTDAAQALASCLICHLSKTDQPPTNPPTETA